MFDGTHLCCRALRVKSFRKTRPEKKVIESNVNALREPMADGRAKNRNLHSRPSQGRTQFNFFASPHCIFPFYFLIFCSSPAVPAHQRSTNTCAFISTLSKCQTQFYRFASIKNPQHSLLGRCRAGLQARVAMVVAVQINTVVSENGPVTRCDSRRQHQNAKYAGEEYTKNLSPPKCPVEINEFSETHCRDVTAASPTNFAPFSTLLLCEAQARTRGKQPNSFSDFRIREFYHFIVWHFAALLRLMCASVQVVGAQLLLPTLPAAPASKALAKRMFDDIRVNLPQVTIIIALDARVRTHCRCHC